MGFFKNYLKKNGTDQVNCDSKTSRKIQQGSLTDLTVASILPRQRSFLRVK